ncbi:MAG TPA: ABC transporter ATP-binding protein [Anaerolineales bacterium]|nr:ABC transporter ATP-binding protein [Anaerolineales bacterium]HNQ95815.1 ABC transporter ATP-binding protein [Anaerolineales bacterium]HNS62530.1 ABC transporter ATP-binding protein [Anaerolineales bacterium]
MSETAIKISHLGKSYNLSHAGAPVRYKTIQEELLRFPKKVWQTMRPGANLQRETFWALDDVSFDVNEGEVLGVIGRNGAGKSTLLKILARITEPTTGRVELFGRVGVLLEVATGFHWELSGRENIFLRGAILGMTRREIEKKFDEIVDFAEMEKFLDTPVKRYSSGMYVRLAFAVAAHLEPEILLVDEVLAVGDLKFQQKCIGKMGEVARSGRTVLFVSHQMAFVENLCTRTVLLDGGRVKALGPTHEIVSMYMQQAHDEPVVFDLASRKDRQGNGLFRFERVWLEDQDNKVVNHFKVGDRSVSIKTAVAPHSAETVEGTAALVINDVSGYRLMTLRSEDKDDLIHADGPSEISFKLDRIHLMPGTYYCNLYFGRWGGNEPYDFVENALALRIEPGDFHEIGKMLPPQPEKFIVNFDITCQPSESAQP